MSRYRLAVDWACGVRSCGIGESRFKFLSMNDTNSISLSSGGKHPTDAATIGCHEFYYLIGILAMVSTTLLLRKITKLCFGWYPCAVGSNDSLLDMTDSENESEENDTRRPRTQEPRSIRVLLGYSPSWCNLGAHNSSKLCG